MIKDNDLDLGSDYNGFASGYFSAIPAPATFSEHSYSPLRRILVDKTTHCIRFENETESSVVVVIEPKEGL